MKKNHPKSFFSGEQKKEQSNANQVATVLAALLLGLFHLSGNLVEVLLHGDGGLGCAKEEQEEEEDRVMTLHLGS